MTYILLEIRNANEDCEYHITTIGEPVDLVVLRSIAGAKVTVIAVSKNRDELESELLRQNLPPGYVGVRSIQLVQDGVRVLGLQDPKK